MKKAHVWTLVVLLAVTFGLIRLRGDTDRVPPSQPLADFPFTLGSWQGQSIAIPQESLAILGKGDFLNRVYQNDAENRAPAVGLFIGYFPTQRSGQSIHSPQNCLPGAGWSFDSSGAADFNAAGEQYRVGEYIISNGVIRQEVLYWYRSHGKNISNDYLAKLHMLKDSVMYNRTDAALIRVITPVAPDEPISVAHDRAIHFAQQFVELLPTYIPN